MPTFLITCATGRQGGSAARILLSKGHKVHALVRDPAAAPALALEALGATLFKGDLADVAAVTAATQGVTSVFLNPFPSFTNPNGEAEAAQTVVDAARAAGTVTSIVLSTVLRADSAPSDIDPAHKAGAERVVRESGFAYTILRPGWLMHNYIGTAPTYHFPEYATQRLLTVSFPEGYRLDHLDAADVGKFTVAAFLEPERFAGKEIDLVRELLTFEEVAAHLSEAAGVEVTARYRTKEETDALKATMPTIEMQLWAPKAPAVDLREYGIELTSFKEFLAREKDALRKTFVQ
ncbi:NAD dependent epimerase/dehydratase [Mycena rebaudengoi]|nr:NAD dependent epimerase/dehydratase [Mycena rebaudengoi]